MFSRRDSCLFVLCACLSAGDFDEVHSYQSGGMVSGLGRVNGHDNYRGNNGGNGHVGNNSQKLTNKGGRVNESSVNEEYLADSYQSSSSNNHANQEKEGLLSNAETGGNGSNNNAMYPGVSPLNVYKVWLTPSMAHHTRMSYVITFLCNNTLRCLGRSGCGPCGRLLHGGTLGACSRTADIRSLSSPFFHLNDVFST